MSADVRGNDGPHVKRKKMSAGGPQGAWSTQTTSAQPRAQHPPKAEEKEETKSPPQLLAQTNQTRHPVFVLVDESGGTLYVSSSDLETHLSSSQTFKALEEDDSDARYVIYDSDKRRPLTDARGSLLEFDDYDAMGEHMDTAVDESIAVVGKLFYRVRLSSVTTLDDLLLVQSLRPDIDMRKFVNVRV